MITHEPNPDLPTFARGLSFLDVPTGKRDADFVVAGIPVDWGVTNRAGTREGPNAIRMISRMLYDGAHPALGSDPKQLDISDIGNFDVRIGDLAKTHEMIEEQASGISHLIALGGDHSITLPLLRAATKERGPVALLHFDAHTDTWSENFGQDFAHGTPFWHAIEEGLLRPEDVVQIGIRAPMDADLFVDAKNRGISIYSAEHVHLAGPLAVVDEIKRVVGTKPTYLTFDVDSLDPGFAPGTGTPEMGGLHPWQVRAILSRLTDIDFIGMDVVEVSPPFDNAEVTALAAATVAWDYLAIQAKRRAAT